MPQEYKGRDQSDAFISQRMPNHQKVGERQEADLIALRRKQPY